MAPRANHAIHPRRRVRLIAAREARGITRDALAEVLGIGRFHVFRVEEGQRNPRFDMMLRWAAAIGAPIEVFRNTRNRAAANRERPPQAAE